VESTTVTEGSGLETRIAASDGSFPIHSYSVAAR